MSQTPVEAKPEGHHAAPDLPAEGHRGRDRPTDLAALLVPGGYTLDRVSRIIQLSLGWQGYHLHSFGDRRLISTVSPTRWAS
jgi:hypothetical protein